MCITMPLAELAVVRAGRGLCDCGVPCDEAVGGRQSLLEGGLLDELLRVASLCCKVGGGGCGAEAPGLAMTDLLLERLALRRRSGLRQVDGFTLWGAERRGSVGGFERERRRRWALGLVSAVLLGYGDALVETLAKLLLALPCEGRSPFVSTTAMKARRWSFGKRRGSFIFVPALVQ
jgi:hypothetical protein